MLFCCVRKLTRTFLVFSHFLHGDCELVVVARLVVTRFAVNAEQFSAQRFFIGCVIVARGLFGLVCLACYWEAYGATFGTLTHTP